MVKKAHSWTSDYNDEEFDDIEQEEWNRFMQSEIRTFNFKKLTGTIVWIVMGFLWCALIFWAFTGEFVLSAIWSMIF